MRPATAPVMTAAFAEKPEATLLAMFPPARSERRAIADRVLDSASMRLKTFFALSMPMAEAAGGQDGDEAEGGKHYHRAAAPDGGETAEEE